MKPRTKLQLKVFNLSKDLYPLSPNQKDWAVTKCLTHKAFRTKHKATCMDCGNAFDTSLIIRKRATCPHCNTKLVVEETKKRTYEQTIYFAIAEVYADFQIIRNFELNSWHRFGSNKKISCIEVLQHWIGSDGKREVLARNHSWNNSMNSWNYYMNSWNGAMEIRDKSNEQKYDIFPDAYWPQSEFKPEYLKYGINAKLDGLTFLQATKTIFDNQKAETLLKAKQYSLLNYSRSNNWMINNYWASIKIAIRHKKYISDASKWMDYMELLKSFGKDLHSPKYLFPKNLTKEHDKLVEKRREKQRKESIERQRKKVAIENEQYLESKASFLDLIFSDKKLKIKVIQSVKEFMEIGDKLKHCVFTNEYYKKDDCLILSAELNGEPIETVEVSLTTMEILQSRGFYNKASEHNAKIISLVQNNISEIQKRVNNI